MQPAREGRAEGERCVLLAACAGSGLACSAQDASVHANASGGDIDGGLGERNLCTGRFLHTKK